MAGIFLGSVYATLEMKTDKFTSGIANAQKSMGGAVGASKIFASGIAAAGVAAGAAMVYAGKQAMNFETQMADVSTLISGDSTKAVDGLRQGILDMVKEIPKTPEDLGASAYAIVSAGISDTGEALKVLEASGKLAVSGLSTTAEATDIMTSALNAFGYEASDSDKVADILFKTVKNGKTTVAEMAGAFGATAPIIASAKISLEEFSAATAALTTTGMPAAQAQNSLRQATVSLMKPTEDMKKLLKEAGYESGQAALEQDGLVKVMQKVDKAAGGSAEELGKAWGSVEALGAATALNGPVAEAFATTMNNMTNEADAMQEAFQKQKETAANSMQLLKNELNAAAITLGTKLLPAVTAFADFMNSTVIPAIKAGAKWLGEHQWALAALTGALIGGLIPALMWLGGVIWATVIPAIVGAIISLAPFMLAGAAVGAIAFLIIKNWDTLKQWFFTAWNAIKNAFVTAFNFVKANWQIFAIVLTGGIGALVVLFITHWNTIKNTAMTVFNAIQAVVMFVFNAIVSIIQFAWSIIEPIFNVWLAVAKFVFQVILVVAAAVFIAIAVAVKALWAVAQFIFNAWLAYAKFVFGIIQAVATAVFNAVAGAVRWAWGIISPILSTLKNVASSVFNTIKNVAVGVFNSIKNFISDRINDVIGFFRGMGSAIGGAMSNVADAVMSPFKKAFNAVAGFWNSTVGKISFNAPDWVPGIGGKGFSMPQIPTLASGGIATKATLAMIGEGNESEAVLPLSKLASLMRNELPSLRNANPRVPNIDADSVGAGAGTTVYVDRVELPNVQNPDDFGREMKLKFASMRGV